MNAVTKVAAKEAFFFENSRLMAIAINATNHNLIYRAQSKPNGPWVTDWAWINNANQYDVMAAGLARDGRVVVLAQVSTTPRGAMNNQEDVISCMVSSLSVGGANS